MVQDFQPVLVGWELDHRVLVDCITKVNKFHPLGWIHVAHKSFGGRCAKERDEIHNCSLQQVGTVEEWKHPFGEPAELVHDPGVAGTFGTDGVAVVVV